jgi:hypothetical protein
MEREAHVLVESRDSTGISLKERVPSDLAGQGLKRMWAVLPRTLLIVKQVRVSRGQV